MSISHYIKEIGRGKEGARSLSREQAADLLGQVLDGSVTDLEIGAFCIAMRVKGETEAEMAGFLDAVHVRLNKVHGERPVVVIPSYNGARKLPGLTMLLAHLLAREGAQRGFDVVVHGSCSEAKRVPTQEVSQQLTQRLNPEAFLKPNQPLALKEYAPNAMHLIANEQPKFFLTAQLSPALERLLQVRRTVGLRNPSHSLVKLMNPTNRADALIVTSYTHPEYLHSMTETLKLTGSHAMLLRGTEGEAVADARRRPRMDGFIHGEPVALCEQQEGSLAHIPELPTCDAPSTAQYIHEVLQGNKPVPAPIFSQVEHILHLMQLMRQERDISS